MREEWLTLFNADGSARHHTFVFTGDPFIILPDLRDFLLHDQNIPAMEVNFQLTEQFSVEVSREWKKILGAPLVGSHRFNLLGFNHITPEAEQALLKTLEEPPVGTVFFIVYPRPLTLAATILSRAWLVEDKSAVVGRVKFLTLSPNERLALVAKELVRLGDEPGASKMLVVEILQAVEVELKTAVGKNLATTLAISAGETLKTARELLLKGSRLSPKFLLEYLSLTLPRL